MNRYRSFPQALALLLACLLASVSSQAAVVYVSALSPAATPDGASWGTAFRTIQNGTDAAVAGDEVWVAGGTYNESVTLKAGVGLYGGFAGTETARDARDPAANPSVVDAQGKGRAVTVPPGARRDTVLDGMTLMNGLDLEGAQPARVGAILCVGASPTIRGNDIIGNGGACGGIFGDCYNVPAGGGVYCEDSDALIEDNVFRGNRAIRGAVIYAKRGAPVVRRNTMESNNGGPGSLLYADGARVTFTDNKATGNIGGLYDDTYPNPEANSGIAIHDAIGVIVARNRFERFSSSSDVYALACYGSSPEVLNNTFQSNAFGILCETGASPLIANNLFRATSRTLRMRPGSSPRVVNNSFLQAEGSAVSAEAGSSGVLANNLIAYNYIGITTSPTSPAALTLRNNNVFANRRGNYYTMPDATGTNGNISADAMMANPARGNDHIQPSSPCRDAGDDASVEPAWTDMDGQPRIQGTHVDIGADESDGTVWNVPDRVIRVRTDGDDANDGSTWALAKRTITAAVTEAIGKDEVWVAAGTYIGQVIVPTGVQLLGGFAGTETTREARVPARNTTVIDGNGIQHAVFVGAGMWRDGVVDGFTITGAKADSFGYGSGIYAYNPVTVRNCVIRNNAAMGVQPTSDTTIEDCVITDNTGPGVSTAKLTSTKFGIVVRRNLIARNQGTGVYLDSFSLGALVERNRIIGNTSTGNGGGVSAANASLVRDNFILGNSAQSGGGIFVGSGGRSRITNNTILNNSAFYTGGYRDSNSTASIFVNNLVAYNTTGINTVGDATVCHHNDVYGNVRSDFEVAGNAIGNMSVDPLFVDREHGNLHLRSDSPLVDVGDDSVVVAGEQDIDNEARSQGAHVDIGADEFSGPVVVTPPPVIRVSPGGNDGNDGSSWNRAKQTLDAALATVNAAGGEVWLAGGTYLGHFAMGAFVSLFGGFRGTEAVPAERDGSAVTVLDGAGTGTVLTAWGSVIARVDGLAIRNGSTGLAAGSTEITVARSSITGQSQLGAYASGGVMRLEDTTVSGNGAGVYTYSVGLALVRCTVSNNQAASSAARKSGVSCLASDVTVQDSLIERNNNCGLVMNTCHVAVTGTTVRLNDGGGLNATWNTGIIQPSVPRRYEIRSSRFTGNRAPSVPALSLAGADVVMDGNFVAYNLATTTPSNGTVSLGATATLTDNVILHNGPAGTSVGLGSGSALTLANNTIAGHGRGVNYTGRALDMANNIVASNGTGLAITVPSFGTVSYNVRKNLFWNTTNIVGSTVSPTANGNIVANPRLAHPSAGDIHIQPDSPAIDAGDDAAAVNDPQDFEGEARIQGAHVDMGADESNGTLWAVTPLFLHVTTRGDDGNDGLTWATAKRNPQAAISQADLGDEVWVAVGSYTSDVTLSLRDRVGVYGGFAGNESARSARSPETKETLLTTTKLIPIVTAPSGVTRAAVLDGFTLRASPNPPTMYPSMGGAILCDGGSPTVSNNRITGNKAGKGGGVACLSGASPFLTGNAITGNTAATEGGGIYAASSAPVLEDNLVSENAAVTGGGIMLNASPNAEILWNDITANRLAGTNPKAAGMYARLSAALIAGNTFLGNDGANSAGGGLYLDASAATVTGNDFSGNLAGSGAGIYILTGAPAVTNNLFEGNGATVTRGGGVALDNTTATVAWNDFEGNRGSAGGGLWMSNGNPVVMSNRFHANEAQIGGGLQATGSAYDIAFNTFTANRATNYGSAVHATSTTASGLIRSNRMSENSAGNGTLYMPSFRGAVRDNAIVRNTAITTPGVYVAGSQVLFVNNTVADNVASVPNSAPAGIYWDASGTVANNIVAFNPTGFFRGEFGSAQFKNNDVFGNGPRNWSGWVDPTGQNGNISQDPGFADRAAGDYRLAAGSPAIDAGEDTLVPAGDRDARGSARILNAHVDMGAYETAVIDTQTIADAVRALAVAGGLAAPEAGIAGLDVDGDAAVSLLDAARLARRGVGLDR